MLPLPKAFSTPCLLFFLFALLTSSSKAGFGFVFGNIALITILLNSSALWPDKEPGSISFFLTSAESSSERTILPGAMEPGLRRFRGVSGEGSRFRFSWRLEGEEGSSAGKVVEAEGPA